MLEQALLRASEGGFSKLTYNGLARSLNVQPQSLYRYVDNIADVKGGVVALYIKKLTESLYHDLLPYSGKEALHQLAVLFVSYTAVGLPFTDMVGGLTAYANDQHVKQEMDQLRDLSTKLVAAVTNDKENIDKNEQLFLNFIVGNLALVTAGAPDKIENHKIFEENIDRLLSLF